MADGSIETKSTVPNDGAAKTENASLEMSEMSRLSPSGTINNEPQKPQISSTPQSLARILTLATNTKLVINYNGKADFIIPTWPELIELAPVECVCDRCTRPMADYAWVCDAQAEAIARRDAVKRAAYDDPVHYLPYFGDALSVRGWVERVFNFRHCTLGAAVNRLPWLGHEIYRMKMEGFMTELQSLGVNERLAWLVAKDIRQCLARQSGSERHNLICSTERTSRHWFDEPVSFLDDILPSYEIVPCMEISLH
ncbi:hypothetical protein F5Y15DRAFT_417533 [Xylariaceae sp. FL0016]|nr:hypothetical protein F5Y15DRAFT_417533 [Xylariaceae sp. FL0016]